MIDSSEVQEMREYIQDLEEECENLSEQNRLLTQRIIELTKEEDYRVCDVCGKKMYEGYLVDDSEYYCSDECLTKVYTPAEYQEMYKNDSAYWTEWEE